MTLGPRLSEFIRNHGLAETIEGVRSLGEPVDHEGNPVRLQAGDYAKYWLIPQGAAVKLMKRWICNAVALMRPDDDGTLELVDWIDNEERCEFRLRYVPTK